MSPKTYQARSMADALRQVKEDLGHDAVILHTRTFQRGGLLGLGRRRMVEISATDLQHAVPREPAATAAPRRFGPAPLAAAVRLESAEASTNNAAFDAGADPAVRGELKEMRILLDQVLRETKASRLPDVPAELVEFYTQLVSRHVADDLARQLLVDLSPVADRPDEVRRLLRERIAAWLPTSGPIGVASSRPWVVALVGPTGVGKTTTLAKLAANAKLRDGRRVGLVTVDTYRIAAVEQLRTYAGILEIPVEVASSPEDMPTVLQRLAACDVIFIDTAGRSPHDEPRIAELQAILAAARPDEVHLVLSSTHGESSAVQAVRRFAMLGADRIVLTKLDEAVGLGVVLSVLRVVNLRLSYVTDGQSVPSDIAEADALVLAARVLDSCDPVASAGGRA